MLKKTSLSTIAVSSWAFRLLIRFMIVIIKLVTVNMRKVTSRLPCKTRSNMPLCRCEYHFVIALRNLGHSRGRLHNATISRNQHERAWKCDDPGGLIFSYDVYNIHLHTYIHIEKEGDRERERKTFDDISKSCKILK